RTQHLPLHPVVGYLPRFVAAFVLALLLAGAFLTPVFAQVDIVGEEPVTEEPADSGPVRATRITGTLPNQFSAHYLGLQPIIRDQPIDLTFSFDPQDPLLRGKVNFIVLTEDGLRRFLAGADPQELDVAAG